MASILRRHKADGRAEANLAEAVNWHRSRRGDAVRCDQIGRSRPPRRPRLETRLIRLASTATLRMNMQAAGDHIRVTGQRRLARSDPSHWPVDDLACRPFGLLAASNRLPQLAFNPVPIQSGPQSVNPKPRPIVACAGNRAVQETNDFRHPPGRASILISCRRRMSEKDVEKSRCPSTLVPPLPGQAGPELSH